jgi:hypothetical protein
MTVIPEVLRAAVAQRAANRCEYCHIPAAGQIGRFPIDHIIPRTKGGKTVIANLAFSCHRCNARKWMHTDGLDPETNETAALFHPREQVWEGHFAWSRESSGILSGKTECGRATIVRLQLNHADLVELRALLAVLGLFPELMS